ncbi:MAG: zf-HC2 domain-containing protein [Gemmatimonadaceae bacterium]
MHLDAEHIERVLHDQLSGADASRVAAHLAECDDCRTSVEGARAEERKTWLLLGTLDSAPRTVRMGDVQRAAAWNVTPRVYRWAAVLLVGVGLAGAGYALPWSPLRRWIDARREAPAVVTTAVVDSMGPAGDVQDMSGVSVVAQGEVVVRFTFAQTEGVVRVSLGEGDDVEVRAPAGTVRFATGAGRIMVDNAGATSDYDVLVPRSSSHVTLQVAGVTVWQKFGSRVVSEHPPGPDGVTRVPVTTVAADDLSPPR